jgi:hypothetical protein
MLAGGGRNRVPELGASGSGEMTLTRHFVPGYFQSPLPKNPARNLKRHLPPTLFLESDYWLVLGKYPVEPSFELKKRLT